MKMQCLTLFLLAISGSAYAEVRHCVAADGTSVFTDRRSHRVGCPVAYSVANLVA